MADSPRSRRQNGQLSFGELHKILLQGRAASSPARPQPRMTHKRRRGGGLKNDHLALLTDPVDQARGIEQRCCLVQKLLHVECDFETLFVKPRASASVRCAPYSRGPIEPAANFGSISLARCFD